jgi:hypothetical protein
MLLTNPYVIAFDFSKAFDTVRQSTLLAKMAQLDIPDNVYNWMADFFSGHSHCTTYRGQASTMQSITASIIQGSGIGPASYVVNAGDLKALTSRNHLCKFADDTYLIVPSGNEGSRLAEIDSIETWAKRNNLMLNRKKTKEIVFVDTKRKRHFETPPLLPEIDRMTSLNILGVTMTDCLSASDHVCDIITRCAQTLFALRVLRTHGMGDPALQTVYQSVVVARVMYASSSWWGFTNAVDRQRVDAFQQLFDKILANPNHLLRNLPPPPTVASQNYNLRSRSHDRQLPPHTGRLTDSNFLTRLLYNDIY